MYIFNNLLAKEDQRSILVITEGYFNSLQKRSTHASLTAATSLSTTIARNNHMRYQRGDTYPWASCHRHAWQCLQPSRWERRGILSSSRWLEWAAGLSATQMKTREVMLVLYMRNVIGHAKRNTTLTTVQYVTLNRVESGSTRIQVKSFNRKQEKDMRALRSVLPQDQLHLSLWLPLHFSLLPVTLFFFLCPWCQILWK